MSRDLIYPFFNTSGNFSLLCFVLKKVLVDRNRSTNKHTTIKKPVVWLFILYFLLSSDLSKTEPHPLGDPTINRKGHLSTWQSLGGHQSEPRSIQYPTGSSDTAQSAFVKQKSMTASEKMNTQDDIDKFEDTAAITPSASALSIATLPPSGTTENRKKKPENRYDHRTNHKRKQHS